MPKKKAGPVRKALYWIGGIILALIGWTVLLDFLKRDDDQRRRHEAEVREAFRGAMGDFELEFAPEVVSRAQAAEPRVDGKAVVFAATVDLKTGRMHPVTIPQFHFDLPDERRADRPADVGTVVWVSMNSIETVTASHVDSAEPYATTEYYNVTVAVYNRGAKTLCIKRRDRVQRPEGEAFVKRLLGA
jgi:hypothetical protein